MFLQESVSLSSDASQTRVEALRKRSVTFHSEEGLGWWLCPQSERVTSPRGGDAHLWTGGDRVCPR